MKLLITFLLLATAVHSQTHINILGGYSSSGGISIGAGAKTKVYKDFDAQFDFRKVEGVKDFENYDVSVRYNVFDFMSLNAGAQHTTPNSSLNGFLGATLFYKVNNILRLMVDYQQLSGIGNISFGFQMRFVPNRDRSKIRFF